MFDENDNVVLVIDKNYLVYKVNFWDIEFKGRILTIRQLSRKIFVEIEFETPNIVNIKRGQIYCKGHILTVTKEGINYKNRNIGIVGGTFIMPFGAVFAIGKSTRNYPTLFQL